jgi:hypothetical protein
MAGDVEASCGLGGYRPSENRSLAAATVQVSWCPMGAKTLEAIRALDEEKGLFVQHEDPQIVKQLNSWKIHN